MNRKMLVSDASPACFQELFWKSVADRGTFSRGSKSWGRGWLLLIKTWPSLGSPIGFHVCAQRLRKSVPSARAYVCVSASVHKKESWLRPGGRGHKPCSDRYTFNAVTHYTKQIPNRAPDRAFDQILSFLCQIAFRCEFSWSMNDRRNLNDNLTDRRLIFLS